MFFAVVNKEDGEKVKKLSKSAKLLISFALCLAVVFSILALNGNYCVKADGGTKYIIEGDVRVQVLSEDVFRIELKSSTGFLDDATLQIAGKNDYSGKGPFCQRFFSKNEKFFYTSCPRTPSASTDTISTGNTWL